jgi:rSAM/selenodomain-associated transferase 2
MTAPVSVIIPTFNSAANLAATLAPLYDGLHQGVVRELILSDGGSCDDTARIADDLGAVWLTGPASRGGQIRRAVDAAQGDWLLILHSDTRLPNDWVDLCMQHLTHQDAGYFDLSFDQGGFAARWTAGWANIRARLFGLPYGDQAMLVPKALLQQVGGYPDIPLMEDVAVAKRLKGRLRPLGSAVVTGADKYRKHGWGRQGMRNITLLLKYLMGADPHELYQRYYRR